MTDRSSPRSPTRTPRWRRTARRGPDSRKASRSSSPAGTCCVTLTRYRMRSRRGSRTESFGSLPRRWPKLSLVPSSSTRLRIRTRRPVTRSRSFSTVRSPSPGTARRRPGPRRRSTSPNSSERPSRLRRRTLRVSRRTPRRTPRMPRQRPKSRRTPRDATASQSEGRGCYGHPLPSPNPLGESNDRLSEPPMPESRMASQSPASPPLRVRHSPLLPNVSTATISRPASRAMDGTAGGVPDRTPAR